MADVDALVSMGFPETKAWVLLCQRGMPHATRVH
jgi:hypothetical protein